MAWRLGRFVFEKSDRWAYRSNEFSNMSYGPCPSPRHATPRRGEADVHTHIHKKPCLQLLLVLMLYARATCRCLTARS